MKSDCCSKEQLEEIKEQFECKCDESDDGIKIEISAKDPSKKQVLKDLFNNIKKFCPCDCSK